MRRLSVLLTLLLALAVLSGSVLAAETVYFFEALPSVSTLPVFEAVAGAEDMMAYNGYLQEGKYAVSIYFPSSSTDFVFSDLFNVVYSESAEEGVVECSFVCELDYMGSPVLATVYIGFVSAENTTFFCFVREDNDEACTFSGDAICVFVPVSADDGSEDPSVIKEIIVDLFGPYEQRTETITETLADGSVVTTEQLVPGVAGLDYPWIASVVLFALALLSFFRLLGGLIKQ